MVGTQVTGKRLGILGFGRVGRVVAKRARGFDMVIHYHDLQRMPPEREEGAIFHPTPEDLMPQCDFLTLHCVASPSTVKLLNAARIALLPDGAIVVNASRGAVIDDDALIAALKSGKLTAAGLDVYNNEPRKKPGMPWGFGRSIIWMPSSPGVNPGTASPERAYHHHFTRSIQDRFSDR
jgi:lactate dehydrogenase-like 2-hydroxyacid dehydrogenase